MSEASTPPATADDDDLALIALLQVWNAPQRNRPDMRPHLARLVEVGLLKNKGRLGDTWWTLTPAGKAVTRAFVEWYGPDKEAFLRRTHGAFW